MGNKEKMINAVLLMIQKSLADIIAHQDAGNRYTEMVGEVIGNDGGYQYKVEVVTGDWQITITKV